MLFFVLLNLFALLSTVLAELHADNVHTIAAQRLIKKARMLLRRDDSSESSGSSSIDWSSPLAIGCIVGGSVLVVLIGYLGYRYKTWVPKTRAARSKAGATTDSNPTSPSSSDERLKLLVAGTKQ